MDTTYNFQETRNLFSYFDYGLFLLLLLSSAGIGLYWGLYKKASSTANEFLYGGGNMGVLPVTISLLASQLSGFTLLAIPSEVYGFGAFFLLQIPVLPLVVILVNTCVIPIYRKLNILTCYEYLELRFGRRVKMLAIYIFIINFLVYLPFTIFLPSLMFAEMTGLNVHITNAAVIMICVGYTIMGGIKGVVWSDVFQFSIMMTCCALILVYGVSGAGGLSEVWNRALEGGRLSIINFTPSLATKNTTWNNSIAFFIVWTSFFGFNQVFVQLLVAVPTEKQSKRVVLLTGIGWCFVNFICVSIGIIMFATYYGCDPIKAKMIEKSDKLVPYFILQTIGHIPGLPGLFISCIFSAALSTMSSTLNALSGVIYKNQVQPLKCFKHTDKRARVMMKIIIFIFGVYSILMGIIVQRFQHLFTVMTASLSVFQSITFGIFSLGMLTPWANQTGVLTGGLVTLVVMMWIGTGNVVSSLLGYKTDLPLPTRVDQCPNNYLDVQIQHTMSPAGDFNTTINDEVFVLYKLSPFNFSMVSVILVWAIGLTVSYFTTPRHLAEDDYDLVAPIIRRWLQRNKVKTEVHEMTREVNLD